MLNFYIMHDPYVSARIVIFLDNGVGMDFPFVNLVFCMTVSHFRYQSNFSSLLILKTNERISFLL